MGKAEILETINRLNREIRNLETSRSLYQSMNTKINDAITKLTSAKDYVNKSYTELEKYYQSNTSSKKVTELESEYTNINSIIKKLKSEILLASNKKISSINSSISSKQSQISRLREQLNSMDSYSRGERRNARRCR